MSKRFYRVAELSRITDIPTRTLYDSIHREEIKALVLGRSIYIPTAEVERILGEPVGDEKEGEMA
jgi:excisionase family DNA binding protein